jgi:hypothetical protein
MKIQDGVKAQSVGRNIELLQNVGSSVAFAGKFVFHKYSNGDVTFYSRYESGKNYNYAAQLTDGKIVILGRKVDALPSYVRKALEILMLS